MQKKILLDTDIGSDIDDALCIAYLLSQPECELLGITTVTGEARKRAMLASALCRKAKKEIPIYPGIEKPLLVKALQPLAGEYDRISAWEHQTEFPELSAIRFLRDTIRSHPGEITLLGIGPMTNLAVLFTIDPEIPSLLKELVLMCGKFECDPQGGNKAEWNARCDPHAAAIVYGAPVKIHRSVGLDVTKKLMMNKEEMLQRFHAPILQPVVDFADDFFAKSDIMTFHDPLTAAVLFDDALCTFRRGTVSIELKSAPLMGLTHWEQDSENGPHEYASEVDVKRFFADYFGVIESNSKTLLTAATV